MKAIRLPAVAILAASLLPLVGCEGMGSYHSNDPDAVVANKHPLVEIQGNDGTMLRGELMNGSITIDCDQGQLTLLTDHIKSITLSPEQDTVDSASIKVSGKITENQFQLRSEHGVFTLLKDRLKRIDFRPEGFTTPLQVPTTTTTTTRHAVHSADARQ